jgi:hypothetical protein
MSATVAATGAAADAEPEADGHGDGAAEAAAAGALPLAAGAAALAAGAGAAALPLAAGAAALALAAAEAQPMADCSIVVALPPPETARIIPRVRPNAIGMARGTAMRAARLLPRRRGADRCPLSIQSTSMWKSPVTLPVHHRRPGPPARSANSGDYGQVRLF